MMKEIDHEFATKSRRDEARMKQAEAMGLSDDDGEGEESEGDAVPMPVDKLAQAIMQQGDMLAQGMAAMGEGFKQLAAAQSAPRRKVANINGKVVEMVDEAMPQAVQ